MPVDPLLRPSLRPRLSSAERPDPETQLLAAISERDCLRVRQLGQALVHRRGFAQLEIFRQGRLKPSLGEGAVTWFDQVLRLDEASQPDLRSSQVGSNGTAATLSDAVSFSRDPQDNDPLQSRVLSEVDAAIAAMMATFPPEPAPAQAWNDDLQDHEGTPAVVQHHAGDPNASVSPPIPAPQGSEGAIALGGVMAISRELGSAGPSGLTGSPPPKQSLSSPFPAFGGDQERGESCPSDESATQELSPGNTVAQDRLERLAPRVDHPDPRHSSSIQATTAAAAAARRGLDRLRRQWPRAAALVRSALIGSSSELSTAHGNGQPAVSNDPSAMAAPWDLPAPGEGRNQLESRDWESPLLRPTPAADVPMGASLPALVRPPAALSSDAERLRRQLAQQPQARLSQGAPAPRPRALAELGAWLPDAELPRAS